MAVTGGKTTSSSANNSYYTKYLNKNVLIRFKNIDTYTLKGKLISFDAYNNITIEEETENKSTHVVIRGCNIDSIEPSE